jgi:hypothetical protein
MAPYAQSPLRVGDGILACYNLSAMAAVTTYQPLLSRVPDARRAPFPLVDPVLLGYLSFILGAPAAALCATYNALLLRRWLLALESAAVGLVAWFAFEPSITYVYEQTLDINIAFIILRLAGLAVGVFLAWRQWPHLRGHVFLDGKVVPILWGVIAGILIGTQLSMATLLTIMGLPT